MKLLNNIKKLFLPNHQAKELYQEIKDQKEKFHKLRKEYEESKHWNLEYSFLVKEATQSMNTLIWHKDKNHRYLLANPLHCQSFFQLDSTIDCLTYVKGKTDLELVKKCFHDQDIKNTFGDICLLSDEHTKQQKRKCHFIEAGIVDDEELLLYLIKIPQFDKDNHFVGSIGMGWNITEQSKRVLKSVNRWKFDGLVDILYNNDCSFCYSIVPDIHKCEIFNHLCCKV